MYASSDETTYAPFILVKAAGCCCDFFMVLLSRIIEMLAGSPPQQCTGKSFGRPRPQGKPFRRLSKYKGRRSTRLFSLVVDEHTSCVFARLYAKEYSSACGRGTSCCVNSSVEPLRPRERDVVLHLFLYLKSMLTCANTRRRFCRFFLSAVQEFGS